MKPPIAARLASLLAFVTIASQAQFINIPAVGSTVLTEKRYTDVQGTPFLYPSWKPGTITDANDKVYPNQLIKYDSHADELQINRDGGTVILNSVVYPKFEFAFTDEETVAKTQRIFRSGFAVEGFTKKSYFEVLFDGNYKLLKKTKTDFMDQNVNSYGSANAVKRFITKVHYFIVDKSGKSFDIRLSKKSLLEALGGDKDSAEAYIKKVGLKVKAESDVIEVLHSLEQP